MQVEQVEQVSPLQAVCSFDNGFVGKQSVAWKEYCAEYWLKELQESRIGALATAI